MTTPVPHCAPGAPAIRTGYAKPEDWTPRNEDYTTDQAQLAKAICGGCPILAQCLKWSLDAGDLKGIRGGMTPDERALLVVTP